MKRSALAVETEFIRGNYGVVQEAFRNDSGLSSGLSKKKELLKWFVGASVFLGDLERAEALTAKVPRSDFETLAACRFFLGIGATRISDYKKARALFGANARIPLKKRKGPLRFYAHQGLAFYRFFCGRYDLARRHAQVAFETSVEEEFLFGEILSRDLLGHASIGAGEVRLGLKHLQAALKLATKVGNGGMASALKTTLVRVRAQFGVEPGAAESELRQALDKLKPEDTYSRAELYLELSRQMILRGRLDQARQTLEEGCDFIYRNQNRRQAAVLNLRFSYIMHLEGQHHQALHLIRTAEAALDLEVDHIQIAQMQGLRARIERTLGRTERSDAILSEARGAAGVLRHGMNSRIVNRDSSLQSFARVGEDPLADLIDRVKARDESALATIVETGFYGLLTQFYGLPLGVKALVFDLVPGSVAILCGGNVILKQKGLNGLLRKMLQVLHEGTRSKEDLIRSVWGHDYDPARHDSLTYSAITKLRRLLEPFGSWIEYGEAGYRLSPDVLLINRSARLKLTGTHLANPAMIQAKSGAFAPVSSRNNEAAVSNRLRVSESPVLQVEKFPELNYRQIQILESLFGSRSINVAECSAQFSTSKITASRDLALLHQLGHCTRVGKGRATRYGLKAGSVEN